MLAGATADRLLLPLPVVATRKESVGLGTHTSAPQTSVVVRQRTVVLPFVNRVLGRGEGLGQFLNPHHPVLKD